MQRFTLVELMTVLAIVAVLAAVGLPMLYDAQLKAKFTEIRVNTAVLVEMTDAFFEANDIEEGDFAQMPSGPVDYTATCGSLSLGKSKADWSCTQPEDAEFFASVGFEADGQVYGSYRIGWMETGVAWPCEGGGLEVANSHSYQDLDGDGAVAQYHCCANNQLNAAAGYTDSGRCSRLLPALGRW